jgi:DNA polymerase
MTSRNQIIDRLQEILTYKQESGIDQIELAPETLNLLQSAEKNPAVRPSAKPAPSPKRQASAPVQKDPPPTQSEIEVTGNTLEEIAKQIGSCTACDLHQSRTQPVPGEGNADRPDILFIGEGPGADEDAAGRPFVGKAGQLLDKMISAMGYRREEVFIANIVKCRPPENRVPFPEEMQACTPYLRAQIALIRPKVIVALGKTAVEGLLNERIAITRDRGKWRTYEQIDLMPTFHPAYLLRSPGKKREAWQDLQEVMKRLGKVVPAVRKNP